MHRTPSAQMLNGSATTSASTVINGSATTGDLFLLCIKKKTENTTRKLCDDRNWLMWWLMLWIMMTKGQTISEWNYEVVISPKIDFCPHYTGQKSWQFFFVFLEKRWLPKLILKLSDLIIWLSDESLMTSCLTIVYWLISDDFLMTVSNMTIILLIRPFHEYFDTTRLNVVISIHST